MTFMDDWRTVAGSPQQWVSAADGTVAVDSPDDAYDNYRLGPVLPALDGSYRLHTRVNIAAPRRGRTATSADLLLNAQDLNTCYVVRFRVRNGVPYLTVEKRMDGVVEQLFDEVRPVGFDHWHDVEVGFGGGRIDVVVDGRQVASLAEFARLTGGAVGAGVSGAAAQFAPLEVSALGPDHVLAERGVLMPSRRAVSEPGVDCGEVANERYRVRFTEHTSDESVTYRAHVEVRGDDAWLPAGDDEQWVVLRGSSGSRRDLYSSMAPQWVLFTEFELLDARTARLRSTENGEFDLTVTWNLAGRNPHVGISLVPQATDHYVVGYQAFSGRSIDDVDEVVCGPLQHARMVRGRESVGSSDLMAPLCLVQHTDGDGAPMTVGLYAAPSELPFEYEPSKGDDAQLFGMSLRNDSDEVQPVLYAPQYGEHAAMQAGSEYRFEVGVYAARAELFEGYRDVLRHEYDYRPYRRNVFGNSLTDTMHNLIDLLMAGPDEDDAVEFRGSPSGWWGRAKGFIDIENDQAVRATTTSVLLSAYYLTADDDVYEQRARPTIEFHMSRNSYGWTPIEGRTVYGDPSRHQVCAAPFGAPALAPLSSMTRGGVPVLSKLALDRLDDEDYWLKRTPMSSPLAAYRMTGEPAILRQAEDAAREYIDSPHPDSVDPHDFQIYYAKAWVELLEMYEETGDKTYLDAAYREAKRYVTQVFARPVPDGAVSVPTRPLKIDDQIELTSWWDPDVLYDYPNSDIPDEDVPCWVVSPNGMSFEALKTYRFNGFTNNPAWAPFLLRLAAHTGDDLLRDIAHNAVVGRYTTYPGYYYRQFSVNHMKPGFAYEGPFGNTTIYYHHAPVQLGMTIDFLLTEHQTRSAGNIEFPSEFEQNYVWFAYRVYGHRPGRFHGHDDAWLWMPRGLVSTGNDQVNWIAAEGGDRLFVSLTNESPATEQVRLRIDADLVPMTSGRAYRVTLVRDNAEPVEAWMTDHVLDTTVSPHGITAVIVHDVGPIEVPLHQSSLDATSTRPDGSFHLDDDTPIGPVWGMVIVKPDRSRYDAYVQAATDQPATLWYSTDGGTTFVSIDRNVQPNEWTVPVHDLSTTLTYYVAVGDRRTEPADLSP